MVFAQAGDASHSGVWAFSLRMVQSLSEKGIAMASVKRLRLLVLELLDNVMHYGNAVRDEACRHYEVEVWKDGAGTLVVHCSNLMHRSDVADFSAYLKRISGYTPAEAKQAVRDALLADFRMASVGAGIGLLTVRQCSLQIDWRFELVDEIYARYIISLRVL